MIWPNGGAAVTYDCYLSKDSFCDPRSLIQGESHIFSSTILSSRVSRAHICDSVISHSQIRDSVLFKTKVEGPRLTNVVAENCELYGDWELDAIAHIPCGVWYRSPRFQLISGNGIKVGLTESTDGHAMMACWRKPVDQWLKAGPRLGIKHGWSLEQIEIARVFYESLI